VNLLDGFDRDDRANRSAMGMSCGLRAAEISGSSIRSGDSTMRDRTFPMAPPRPATAGPYLEVSCRGSPNFPDRRCLARGARERGSVGRSWPHANVLAIGRSSRALGAWGDCRLAI